MDMWTALIGIAAAVALVLALLNHLGIDLTDN